MKISNLKAREILDSRGHPTVEVDIILENGILGRAGVASGASTGTYEAYELRDQDKDRYKGKGVRKAVKNLNNEIKNTLIGMKVTELKKIDEDLIALDGTKNKSRLGANAILGASMAVAKAAAQSEGQSLFRYLGGSEACKLPVPLMNVLNGGAHANNGLDVQEYMLVPMCGGQFSESLRVGCEVFHTLKKLLNEKKLSTAVGDEGGFAPILKSNKEALELLAFSIEKAGYKVGEDVAMALDVASTELFQDGQYEWEGSKVSAAELGEVYSSWMKEFPLVSIEDGFAEDDWPGWIDFTKAQGENIQLVGDDLFVTHPERLKKGIKQQAANALLVKVNQIGSLSETHQAVKMAQEAGLKCIMSHRSGETEDSTIADLAVAMKTEQIKAGSASRSDRMAKYNQLLRIEEELGAKAQFWGPAAFKN